MKHWRMKYSLGSAWSLAVAPLFDIFQYSSHRPTELLGGEAGVVQRQERRRFHALGSRADEVRRPVVPRAAERDGELGLERVDAHHGQRPEEHGDVEPLDVHGLELRRRVEAG